MSLTAGLTLVCADLNCPGGMSKLYLANKDDVTSFTAGGTGEYTAVTMNGLAVFFEFDFQDFTGEFRENSAINENGCGFTVTDEVEVTFPCHTLEVRNSIEEMFSASCCGMIAIVELFDGSLWVIGELDKRHVKVQSTTGTTGKAISDSSNTVLLLQCITTQLAYKFTGVVPV